MKTEGREMQRLNILHQMYRKVNVKNVVVFLFSAILIFIETAGISISIRNLFNSEKIQFKLNDPDSSLPTPFPVFESWTSFSEDEHFESRRYQIKLKTLTKRVVFA